MKLYISSEGIADIKAFSDFIGKPAHEIKLGLIFHAKDYKPEPERSQKLKAATDHFEQFGINVEVIDLFSKPSKDDLQGFDVIWLNGGNTFYLSWALTESEMKDTLTEVFESGVVYAGDSAGAVIAGPDIERYGVADDPATAPYVVNEGLNYIDIGIIPHWGSEEYAAVLGGIEESFKTAGHKTIRLSDDGYLLIEDGKIVKEEF